MARLIWMWLQVLIFKARCLGWCTTTFCPVCDSIWMTAAITVSMLFARRCVLWPVQPQGMAQLGAVGKGQSFLSADWLTAAKKQKSCPSWRPGLGGTTSGLLHAGLLQAGAKSGSHELPCRDVYLSLLKQPESDEIRLGHLIYRHLRWNEVQSCDKKKKKNKKKIQSYMMLNKIPPRPLWIVCLEADPCETKLRSPGTEDEEQLLYSVISVDQLLTSPDVFLLRFGHFSPCTISGLKTHQFLLHQCSRSNVFQLPHWLRWGLFLPSACLLGTHLQNTALHLVCALPGPLSVMFPCPSVALWALPTKAFVLKVGFSFVQRSLGQQHIMFCGFFVEKIPLCTDSVFRNVLEIIHISPICHCCENCVPAGSAAQWLKN